MAGTGAKKAIPDIEAHTQWENKWHRFYLQSSSYLEDQHLLLPCTAINVGHLARSSSKR